MNKSSYLAYLPSRRYTLGFSRKPQILCWFRKSKLPRDLWQFKVFRKETWIQTQTLPLSCTTLWSQLSAPLINLILDSLPPIEYDDSFKPSKRQHEVKGMPSHPQTDILFLFFFICLATQILYNKSRVIKYLCMTPSHHYFWTVCCNFIKMATMLFAAIWSLGSHSGLGF